MPSFNLRLTQLRALAEPTRFRLMLLLGDGELTVTEMTFILEQAQPGISRHLKVLTEAGLASRHTDGAWVYYGRIVPPYLVAALSDLDTVSLQRDRARLDEVKDRRAREARRYFAEHAREWDAIRRRDLDTKAIEQALADLCPVAGQAPTRLVDLGTGTGEMLTLLADRYDHGIGFDISSEMLAVAREKLARRGITKATLRRGDLRNLPDAAGSADIVVLNHVLHYLDEPHAALANAAELLRPGGAILLSDLARHEREDLREHHAHRRLGFSDAEIDEAALSAKLIVSQRRTIPPVNADGLVAKIWLLRQRDDKTENERHDAT